MPPVSSHLNILVLSHIRPSDRGESGICTVLNYVDVMHYYTIHAKTYHILALKMHIKRAQRPACILWLEPNQPQCGDMQSRGEPASTEGCFDREDVIGSYFAS